MMVALGMASAAGVVAYIGLLILTHDIKELQKRVSKLGAKS